MGKGDAIVGISNLEWADRLMPDLHPQVEQVRCNLPQSDLGHVQISCRGEHRMKQYFTVPQVKCDRICPGRELL